MSLANMLLLGTGSVRATGKKRGETPSKLTRKFLIFLCLIKSTTCLKSENEIKFANVSRDFDLFGKMLLCSPVYTRNA